MEDRSKCLWKGTLVPWLGVLSLIAGGRCGKVSVPQRAPLARAILHVGTGPTYDFGSVPVGEGRDVTFDVFNAGSEPADSLDSQFYLSLNFVYVGGEFPGVEGTCGHSLAPGARCTIQVGFAPRYETNFEAAVEIEYFDGERTRVTSTPILRGTGRAP